VVFLARLFGETEAHNSILVETAIGGTSSAIVVDAILGEEEVFVRPLPLVAGAPTAVEGIALISSGRPVAVISLQRLGPIDLATSSGGQAPGPPRHLRVLLVEDSRVTLEMLRRLLEDGGFDVTGVSSAEEALDHLGAEAFDCLVTDIEMPGLSGIELTRRLRSSESMSGMPVVVVSTRERPADRLAGLEAGADAYFTKQGLDAEVLVSLIRRVGGR
jgi:CheY-like chemotaxis protein